MHIRTLQCGHPVVADLRQSIICIYNTSHADKHVARA
jgi:hypothetical protein